MARYRWKFLYKKGRSITSAHGDLKWKLNEWMHVDGSIRTCGNGLHCSKGILQAMGYVQGEVLAKVEVKGSHADEDDKEAWSDMRIVEAYKWTKADSVALSIFAAELCLKEFEKLYPDDKRPREAIEAAKAVLKNDTAANREKAEAAESAAWSAAESAARSAWSAAESARSAAWSAWSAARSARSAAWSARSAAESAAWSAESAAWSAAREKLVRKIEKWLVNRLEEMEKL